MNQILIKNARVVNEGQVFSADLLIERERISKIDKNGISTESAKVIDLGGKLLLPGVIDDQVHFREPGLTHKEDIWHGSRSAVSGGITSFMEMPNTNPLTITQELLEEKYQNAATKSFANFSFYMGTSNDNLEEVLKTNYKNVCGIKIFMGSSTGNMLVDDPKVLRALFSKNHPNLPIAVHCEDETTIKNNLAYYLEKFGNSIDATYHPLIRSEEACYLSSSLAVSLAKEYNTRLHVLHLTTEKELSHFRNDIPSKEKRITAEVCVHHLWFSDQSYPTKGNFIKWNPSIKKESDRRALFAAMLDGRIDVIATDHAPHTIEEKYRPYHHAPSGGPMVQHSLPVMLEFFHKKKVSLEHIVQKMCHTPADIFQVKDRGYIREGYYADLVVVDTEKAVRVSKQNTNYKCGWSPLEGEELHALVDITFVNGNIVYENGTWNESVRGKRLEFER
jgi:dihydroorotase